MYTQLNSVKLFKKGNKMKYLIAMMITAFGISSAFAADAKKEEKKADAPKAEAKKDEKKADPAKK
ncbi:MAG: hypothetical protein EB101_06265 [Chitinophagia bacterium]|nr:hypothetical protein [Chitinophagia bacterium]